ncbi:hypothetical protein [Lysobacter gummosus]|uniref:hypothetical protein n=1 Tax=Lysobacter gummosus TaxID=262324 RepID=UPI003626939F
MASNRIARVSSSDECCRSRALHSLRFRRQRIDVDRGDAAISYGRRVDTQCHCVSIASASMLGRSTRPARRASFNEDDACFRMRRNVTRREPRSLCSLPVKSGPPRLDPLLTAQPSA